MENENQKSREDRFMRALAIVGFIVVAILLAWLAVQVVRVLPGAFSSLARLAEDVNTPQRDLSLDVAVSNNVVNSRSSVEIVWTDMEIPGTYTFTYACVDGVRADVRTADGTLVPVDCEASYEVEENVFELEVTFVSERSRFADVAYRIGFTPDDEDEDSSEVGKTLTVVNANIPLAGEPADDVDEEPVATRPATTTRPTTSAPTQYRTVVTQTLKTPVSDPNGYTELQVAFISVGTLDSKNRFKPQSKLEEGERGAFQFEVKNIGTKTSGTWTFEAELPDGVEYDSKPQDALKPQERSIVTIAFEVDEDGREDIGATIKGGNDKSSSNNSFSKTVTVTR